MNAFLWLAGLLVLFVTLWILFAKVDNPDDYDDMEDSESGYR